MTAIEDYALLGDLQTAVLVSREGSIDWCCLPRFDSGACFAALLGGPADGRWLLAPDDPVVARRRSYRVDTLILDTEVETAGGRVRITDFMPPRGVEPDLVRIVEGLEGRVRLRSELVVRFDYGHIVPWVRRVEDAVVAVAGPDALCFRTPAPTHGEGFTTVSTFTVAAGERVPFVLTWYPSHEPLPSAIDPERALTETAAYWHGWAAGCTHEGPFHDEIHASLLVLKALTYAPTGGMVAAPTTSLPEAIGGPRNWDYRYCWLRDASLSLSAMLKAGYEGEAESWRDWLLRAVAGAPRDLQIMYGIAGERRLDERELPWLEGFAGSRPVRVGNAASTQLQLDVYGEVMGALLHTTRAGVGISDAAWSLVRHLLTWLEDGWREPDAGIWEVRGPTRHFTHSKVMAWFAFDQALRFHDELGRGGPVERWRALRDEIAVEVLDRAWSERKQAFAQSYGSDELDASVLLMPSLGFLPAEDPRFVATLAAVERELVIDGLVRRYLPRRDGAVDGLPADEGAFLACSFWLVDALALSGRRDEALALFERLLALRNDVGLLAEEYDPVAGRQLGNFPQASTHLSLVNSAITLGEGHGVRDGAEAGVSGAGPRGTTAPVSDHGGVTMTKSDERPSGRDDDEREVMTGEGVARVPEREPRMTGQGSTAEDEEPASD